MRAGARSSQWSALNALGAIRVVAIVLRAEFKCTYCEARVPKGRRHVDHVIARAEGGPSTPDNLVLACSDCNQNRPWAHGGVPLRAQLRGRTKRQIDREIARQTAIAIEPGTDLYERAARIAEDWYPEHFARKARARAAYVNRTAEAFDFGHNLAGAA